MKTILLFVLLASSQLVSFAQNALFLPFGQNDQQITAYLNTRDYIQAIHNNEKDQIVNQVSETRQVIYHLKDQLLYATEDIRIFSNKQQMEEALKSCREYMKDGKNQPKALNSNTYDKHYLIVKADQIIELTVKKDAKTKTYVLSLKVTSRNYGPRMATQKIAEQFS